MIISRFYLLCFQSSAARPQGRAAQVVQLGMRNRQIPCGWREISNVHAGFRSGINIGAGCLLMWITLGISVLARGGDPELLQPHEDISYHAIATDSMKSECFARIFAD